MTDGIYFIVSREIWINYIVLGIIFSANNTIIRFYVTRAQIPCGHIILVVLKLDIHVNIHHMLLLHKNQMRCS